MLSPERVAVGVKDELRVQELSRALGVSPLLAHLMTRRGVGDVAAARRYLEAGPEACHDPRLMRDMEAAVALVGGALGRGPILLHGDYDVDGICATVLLVEGLRRLGGRILYHVPHRLREGYGISIEAVERAAAEGAVLLLTVDCGTSNVEAVARARALGMQVVISDHHRLPDHLPDPDAFLNPQRPDCGYPEKGLCGAGVAYKLLHALHLSRGLPEPEEGLDLVALALIADVVPLQGENRILARRGLARMERWERPGLQALAQVSGLPEGPLGSEAVSFRLGPRLNAAGRVGTAEVAVELLLEQDPDRCREGALALEELNRERQRVEAEVRARIEASLLEEPERAAHGLLLEGGEAWHHGVLGITAARLVETYGLPAFVFSLEGGVARGSARAPVGTDLFEAMSRCADLFVKFGGHARAAGFTVEAHRLEELRARLGRAVSEVRTDPPPLEVDLELSLEEVERALVEELGRLEPIGEGNPKPLFLARRVRLEGARAVGQGGAHLSFEARQGSARLRGVGFQLGGLLPWVAPGELSFDVLFSLEVDEWQGRARIQLLLEDVMAPDPQVLAGLGALPEPAAGAPGGEAGPPRGGGRLVDARGVLARKKYARGVAEGGGRVLVLGRQAELAERLAGGLPGEAVGAGFEGPPRDTGRFEEVLLLDPLPDLDLLQRPPLRGAGRLHLLFGDRELAWLEHASREAALDRPDLERLFRELKALSRAGQGLERASLEGLAERFGGERRMALALSVLEELGVVRLGEGGVGLRVLGGRGRRLEASPRFQALARSAREGLRAWGVFRSPQVELGPWLAGAERGEGSGLGAGKLGPMQPLEPPHLDLRSHIRDVPDFPEPGIVFKDLTTLLKHPGAFREAIARMTDLVQGVEATHVVAVEARGYLIGAPLAYNLGLGFVPLRKPGKLPASTLSESYSLEYGRNVLEVHDDALASGDRALIIDDVIATGGSARAAAALVERLGAEVAAFGFLIELGFLQGRQALAGYEIRSVLQY